jgi:E3 ubiquitin-protein ligase HUWE1
VSRLLSRPEHPEADASQADFRSLFRSRHGAATAIPEDGINPLLRRGDGDSRDTSTRRSNVTNVRVSGVLSGPGGPLALLNDLVAHLPSMGPTGQALQFHIAAESRGGHHHDFAVPPPHWRAREVLADTRRDTYQDPQAAVLYDTKTTMEHWQNEAVMIYGKNHADKATKLFYGRTLSVLTPEAMQRAKEEKVRREAEERRLEEERKQKEEEKKAAKEAQEKAEREQAEAEKKERLEREMAALFQAVREEPVDFAVDVPTVDAMEGVETTGTGAQQTEPDASAPDEPRITTTIRGEEIDVTGLGIDPEYLAALPEEFREEVITQTVTARRSEARQQAQTSGGDQSENFNEFLEALPEDLRMEIVQQERQEQRRRQREEERRQAVGSGQEAPGVGDMDTASILMTFPPELRDQVLMEQHEELMDHLPPDMIAQARALLERHRPPPTHAHARAPGRVVAGVSTTAEPKIERRTVVQMLDKPGVATLLRLMFVSQQGSIRSSLFNTFADICENRQNRLEVVGTLLQILQDGSADMDAVDRSFGQLSVKAKPPKDRDPKTPNSLKRTYTNISASNHLQPSSEISPLMIVQQCLDLLVDLSCRSSHIPIVFLTEQEAIGTSLKRGLGRKGKAKDVKASKYAINSILGLLGRALVMESSSVMQLLAELLYRVTLPLQALERRKKENSDAGNKNALDTAPTETTQQAADTATSEATPMPNGEDSNSVATVPPATAGTSADVTAVEPMAATEVEGESSKVVEEKKDSANKKSRQLQPPVIPVHNLTLIINIFVARECSSKTFQNTISTIKNLSNIPDAKLVFGQELVRQANKLSQNIVSDLEELLPHILKAESGTEIQGVALAKFSPGASEQNKLLRVLTALDHLFDGKGKKSSNAETDATVDGERRQEFLNSLYHNATFGIMWERLSACLGAIRQRESMLNVATILLPLIESLMVVCKNTTVADAPAALSQTQSQVGKDILLSSPPPESRMAGLFFTFTEDHRRILNGLVRHNPKLMSGTFSLLVKNPKVLDFDNKRNYFSRSVHARSNGQARPSFPPLQLQVRREQVFHDSYKSLFFKKGDEMKYGKLSIRFHNEEGVDAGGVTREWFQVLTRQMFDPNYALFIPVSSDRTTFHPNKLSGINEEHLRFFKFIGRIIGKALYEGRLLDCYFSRVVYKRILGNAVSVKDMESFDPDYYKSLVWLLENDITDIITETFSTAEDEFGVTTIVDLCENGRNIAVTEENKHEYVRLIVEHRLLSSVKEQMEWFLAGFHDIIPAELIAIFNEQELELLISGLPDVDVDDWRGNSEYHNYTAASPQIQWFWRAVRSFDKEEKAKLLQFVTGTSKVPLNGFKELEGMNGISRFNIHQDYGNTERLPSSHTCFNRKFSVEQFGQRRR